MDPREEEELRHLVRKELEARERMRRERESDLRVRREAGGLSVDRKRIIEAEIEDFYLSKGYRRFENEDGELEWLSDEELREREGQLPIDMEELDVEQRRVRNRFILLAILGFLGVVLLFILMQDRTGSIQVISNIPGATVVLNGSPTEFLTDCRLEHVKAGPHMISISKYGYVPDGAANARVDLKAGHNEVVVLKLKPHYTDSLGRSR
ncbi:PEGA domain-containing protein [candidate division KSB1 bacterium]|nr:MAG: PEGA domain-containing protein [candidate division KSB1 bacterium]